MRPSWRTARASETALPRTGIGLASLIAGLLVVSACGPSVGSSAAPASGGADSSVAAATPDLHIAGSVDANGVFQLLARAKLSVHQETLQGPGPKGEPNATLFIVDGSIKVSIDSFSSPAAVAAAGYRPGSRPVRGDAPYTFWAKNVVIHVGTRQAGALPAGPDSATQVAAEEIVRAIDPYLGPLNQRSVVPIQLPTVATPEPVVVTPPPAATASPSPKATPKPTPKPTKKPKPTVKP
jgi:hypothetical protein